MDRFITGLLFLQEKIRISYKVTLIHRPTRSLLDVEIMGRIRIFMDVVLRTLKAIYISTSLWFCLWFNA